MQKQQKLERQVVKKGQKKKINRKDKLQQEFQKHIEEQLRQEKLSELEDSLKEPVVLPSAIEIYQQKLSDKRQTAYQNLKLLDQNSLLAMNFAHVVPQEIHFQQIYIYP